MLIEYFVGEGGLGGRMKGVGSRGRIRDRVYLVGEKVKYDIDYYLKNQILPAVENIFEVFGVDVFDVVAGSEQRKLF